MFVLSVNVREYLLRILSEQFVEGGNCQEYNFIKNLINFLSPLLNYDRFLKKGIFASRGKSRRKRHRKSQSKRVSKKKKTNIFG